MAYTIKEIFYTLQGEGAHTGRAAVFCRFTGCNLWTGREEDRHKAICQFCDTDFVGTDGENGGKYASAEDVAAMIEATWAGGDAHRYVVCTGGEPTLQLDTDVINALHSRGFMVAIETNGTRPVPAGIDWICVSPKAGADLVQTHGNELKLVYPQLGMEPERFIDLGFDSWFLQPMDGPRQAQNTAAAIDYIKRNPSWRLSTQTHKLNGIP